MLTSPGSAAQRTFLNAAFASANTLVSLAEGNTAEGFSRDGTQVFQWLYGTAGLDMMRTSVRMNLRGIAQNAVAVQGDPQGGDSTSADVRVFCTHDRLREGRARANGERRIFDPVTKEFLKAKFDCTHALAWTIVPDDEDANEPDTLQICPWFLDYAMKQTAQFQNQFKPGKIASMISSLKLDRLAAWVVYTPIDLFQLFDKVMVHELSHTRRGGQTDDIGGFSGYGWKNCRKLAAERGDKAPHRNADSIALFASISGLINAGGMVREDGTFVHGPGAAGGGGDGQAGGGKRSIMIPDEIREPVPVLEPRIKLVPEPPVVKERASHFHASRLKGRRLF